MVHDDDRRERVLDAAAVLFVKYGYDKTTVGDIAKHAGISKGAVYLVFQSKDDLFEALLLREMARFSDAWFERVEAHPLGGTLGAMYESMLWALDASPFVASVFRRDPALLGRYLQKPNHMFQAYASGQSTRKEVIEMLQSVGAVRSDIDARVIAQIMNILAHGLFASAPMGPPEDVPPLDDTIRGIANIMDRALTPPDSDSEAGKAVLRRVFEAGRERLSQMLAAKRNDGGES